MQHQEGFFSGVGGAKIYYQCWLPEGEPKAVLLIVHGLAEHSLLSSLAPKLGRLGLDANGVSRDPAVVQAYVGDPQVYTGKTTARLAAELLKTMQRVTREASKITLPVLIVQGSADKLVNPAGAQMLYDTASSADKTVKIYDGFYHKVFNEPERGQVLGDVEAWLEAH